MSFVLDIKKKPTFKITVTFEILVPIFLLFFFLKEIKLLCTTQIFQNVTGNDHFIAIQ